MDYYDLLQAEIAKQREVYRTLKAGRREGVCYQACQDKTYGTQDANYQNRLRLAYYLLYEKVDDEPVIFWLFQEELKDREANSFQGIGSTVEILTFLLQKYNVGQKYDAWFAQMKNANFDCACGYDPELPVCDTLADNDLLDCVYLCEELGYKETMEILVAQWKDSVGEWDDGNRGQLIRFYSFLGRKEENKALYLEQLSSAKRAGKVADVVSAYDKLIRHCLDCGNYSDAHGYLDEVRAAELWQVKSRRVFRGLLEEAAEVVCQEREAETGAGKGSGAESETAGARKWNGADSEAVGKGNRADSEAAGRGMDSQQNASLNAQQNPKTTELWEWTKNELQGNKNWYGNLYTKSIAAAKAMRDPYAATLEKAYKAWCKETELG